MKKSKLQAAKEQYSKALKRFDKASAAYASSPSIARLQTMKRAREAASVAEDILRFFPPEDT
jgi:hypothetical protein